MFTFRSLMYWTKSHEHPTTCRFTTTMRHACIAHHYMRQLPGCYRASTDRWHARHAHWRTAPTCEPPLPAPKHTSRAAALEATFASAAAAAKPRGCSARPLASSCETVGFCGVRPLQNGRRKGTSVKEAGSTGARGPERSGGACRVLLEGGGGGLEPKSPKVCGPKIAQIKISFGKFHFFPR